jgi:hypothetical protein
MDELWNINGLPDAGFIELQIFAKGVAVFCDSVQNCLMQQVSSPSLGGIKAPKGRYMKSALADFIGGSDHGF